MAAKKPAVVEQVETAVQAALGPINSIQDKVRETTEKGMEQVRAQYEAVKEAAEKATGKIEESVNAVKTGTIDFNMKALDLFRKNANATFDHVEALMGVKSAQDLFNLNSEFLKKQTEVFAGQAKELAALGQKVATEAAEPVKSALEAQFNKK